MSVETFVINSYNANVFPMPYQVRSVQVRNHSGSRVSVAGEVGVPQYIEAQTTQVVYLDPTNTVVITPLTPQAGDISATLADYHLPMNNANQGTVPGTQPVSITSGAVQINGTVATVIQGVMQAVINAGIVTINNGPNAPIPVSQVAPNIVHVHLVQNTVSVTLTKNSVALSVYLTSINGRALLDVYYQTTAPDGTALTVYLVRAAPVVAPTFSTDVPPPWEFDQQFQIGETLYFRCTGTADLVVVY